MRTDYTEVFQDTAAAEKYEHVVYAPDSYATAVSRRQRTYLRGLVRREFPYRRPVQHDFACGTGRAIRLLHGLVRAAHGYDTSAAMLAKASEVAGHATLHEVPADGPVPRPAESERPALVTIFRLLLNVDAAVRDRAIAFAAQLLPHRDAGLLVVENHGNRRSLRHLSHRRRANDPWFAELSHEEVAELLSRHGFTIVEQRGCTLFPQGWYARRWLRPLVRVVDDVCTRFRLFGNAAVNVLYVARRTAPAPRRPNPAGAGVAASARGPAARPSAAVPTAGAAGTDQPPRSAPTRPMP
ncbi:MAG TPA: methyltransferase domain-containing protein [Pilimelia sp.]|nr:methyltransferase domain-containing protein [Pilimelia sp.]